jgi:hypothetical membrane protein
MSIPASRSCTAPLGKMERILLAAGLIPLPWFLIWTSIGGALAPGYSAISQHGSELTLLPGVPHVMLDIAAIGTGVAFIAFAIGMWLESGKKLAIGAAAFIIFGLSMVSNGIWIMGSPMHGLYALGLVILIAPALSQLESQRLRNNRFAFAITAFVSVAGFVYLWMNVVRADPEHLRGLTQRIFSSINSLWPATMAYLLLWKETGSEE